MSKQEPELKSQIVNQVKKVKECVLNPQKVKELATRVESTEKRKRNLQCLWPFVFSPLLAHFLCLESKKAEAEAKAIEEKVSAIHEKIMEITQGKTNEAQKKLDAVTKKYDKTRSTITQLQVAIKAAERNAKKASERIANMKLELEEAEKRRKEIEEENETLERDTKQATEIAAAVKVNDLITRAVVYPLLGW